MNSTLRNILAVIAGLVGGSLINMGTIFLGTAVIGLPEGVDPADMESIASNIDRFTTVHFITPFLAHALGSGLGARIAGAVATGNRLWPCMFVGAFFLLGGIYNATVIPAPTWFIATDLILAYIPMAYLGYSFSRRANK